LSFFDDVDDEPQTASQRPVQGSRRTSGGGRRPPSRGRRPPGGRRPPTDSQSIQVRRGIAAVVIIVVLILIILGIHSCQVSSRNSALKDYNNSINSIMVQSNGTATQLFSELSGGGGASNVTNLHAQVEQTRANALKAYESAKALSVPSQVSSAQTYVLLALRMRVDGITNIGNEIEQALNSTTSQSAVSEIATQMARFYASDVTFIDYAEPQIASALNSAVGSGNWTPYSGGQFLKSIDWLGPSYVASKLGATIPQPKTGKCVSGQLVGNSLNFVSVGGQQLSTGGGNTVTASPPPTFTFNVTNGGQTTLSGVQLTVSVQGTSVKGTGTISIIKPGQTATGTVTLSSQPPSGNYQVVATVVGVHCETNTANNSETIPVTFQ
jgi:archaellum component FlaF (FlaF/FlaG flagellin family)